MRAVWSWLMDLVEFDRPISAEEGAKALTGAGLEVEDYIEVGNDFSGVVIAEVVSKEAHPKADKLTIVKVRDADGAEPVVVVCGASNVPDAGGRVLWAKPGAVLPGGFELGEKKLKGVMSAGMLCAEDELGLGDGHDGIVVLGADAQELSLGAEASDALGLRDVVLDLCIPANRADALGHLGIARELAALLGGKVVAPDSSLAKGGPETPSTKVAIESNACTRYSAQRVTGLKVAPSPMWMQQRLRHVGVRPINNLVDITNYVMFETGQPLHAFDAARLSAGEIRVRPAEAGEKMHTLDDVERTLQGTDLLICDGKTPVALAGVMGGQSAEVSDTTTEVLLESACFDAMTIRRTAKRVALHSDSSYRFERGVDPNGVLLAGARAVSLYVEHCGGSIAGAVVDEYPQPVGTERVSLRMSRCKALSGIEIDEDAACDTLERQGLHVHSRENGVLHVDVPSARGDIRREVDLIEEVVRMHGFDRVPATLPATRNHPTRVADKRRVGAARALQSIGFCEHISYGFTSPERIAKLGYAESDPRSKPIAIDNPMTVEQSVMRTSLWPGLFAALEHNQKRDVADVRLFELGHVFLRGDEGSPVEPLELCAIMAGGRENWLAPTRAFDFFDAKGALVHLLESLYGARDWQCKVGSGSQLFHPGVSAEITDENGEIRAQVGELHPSLRADFDINGEVFGFSLQLGALPMPRHFQMSDLPRFPAITRDISILLSAELPASQVRDTMGAKDQELVSSVQLLEDYRDPTHIPEGKKAMLWSVTYRAADRTLTDAEVDKVHATLTERLLKELPATQR